MCLRRGDHGRRASRWHERIFDHFRVERREGVSLRTGLSGGERRSAGTIVRTASAAPTTLKNFLIDERPRPTAAGRFGLAALVLDQAAGRVIGAANVKPYSAFIRSM